MTSTKMNPKSWRYQTEFKKKTSGLLFHLFRRLKLQMRSSYLCNRKVQLTAAAHWSCKLGGQYELSVSREQVDTQRVCKFYVSLPTCDRPISTWSLTGCSREDVGNKQARLSVCVPMCTYMGLLCCFLLWFYLLIKIYLSPRTGIGWGAQKHYKSWFVCRIRWAEFCWYSDTSICEHISARTHANTHTRTHVQQGYEITNKEMGRT